MLFARPAEALDPFTTQPLEFTRAQRRGTDGLDSTEVTIGTVRCVPADKPHVILQLACSFLPARDTTIEWARFRARLRFETTDTAAVALDLYPREVYQAAERQLALTVEPNLRFASMEMSVGKADIVVQRVKQVPVTIAAGLQENVFHWQMEHTDEHPLVGARGFYALVPWPDETDAIVAELGVVADIVTRKGVFRAATKEHRDAPSLIQRVKLDQ